MRMIWEDTVTRLCDVLLGLSASDHHGKELDHDEMFEKLEEMTLRIRKNDKCVFFIGNGASASMASHLAADLAKNRCIRTQVFTDPAFITAMGNDISFEEAYAEALRLYMRTGDMLVAISSSGNSPNIVRAVGEARRLGGVVITLSAMNKQNSIRKLGDLNLYVPAESYGLAESAHATILHFWVDSLKGLDRDRIHTPMSSTQGRQSRVGSER